MPKDATTNTISITSICTEHRRRYVVSEELRFEGYHDELRRTNNDFLPKLYPESIEIK